MHALRVSLASLALAAACGSKSTTSSSPVEDGVTPTTTADATQGTPMQEIQAQLAREHNVAPTDVKVRLIDKPVVPGVTVFAATIDPKKLGRNASRFGILESGKLYVEQEAMGRVARAWGYGPARTVSAADVAKIFGTLHSARDGVAPLVNAGTLETFKATAYPKQAAAAQLPAETTVEGLPAVTYCITSGARTIPFSVVTAIIRPDFTVELRLQPIAKD